jgi:hypothetical protein
MEVRQFFNPSIKNGWTSLSVHCDLDLASLYQLICMTQTSKMDLVNEVNGTPKVPPVSIEGVGDDKASKILLHEAVMEGPSCQ